MKPITIRIDEETIEKLQMLSQYYKINNVSGIIRLAIALFIRNEERRAFNDEHEQSN